MSDQVAAGWAISSKKPGQAQGYQITCARRDNSTAGCLVVTAEQMGTPEGRRAGHVDALPWSTFTGGGTDDEPMVALASIEWSDESDGTGQPIAPARMIWLPWASVAERRLDHLSLWRGAARLRWPAVDSGPEGATGHRVMITVPLPDPDRIIDRIRHNFDYVAQIAALLVDGRRVAIVLSQGDSVSISERLLLLDAVLALLPFGARNCLTVATWASYKAAQGAELTFSDGSQHDQVGVLWRDDRELGLLGTLGRDYLNELRTIIGQGYELKQIVDHLAASTEPLRHIDEHALSVLSGIRFGSLVYEEVERGEGSIDRVQRVLQEGRYSDEHLRAFARFLAVSACSTDRKKAKQAGEIIVAEWRPTFSRVLGELCRDSKPAVAGQEETWLALSQEAEKTHTGASTEFLAYALRLPVVRVEDQAMVALSTLTVEYLAKTKSIDETTYQNLVAQPHVLVRALSVTLLSGDDSMLKRKAAELRKRFDRNLNGTLRAFLGYAELMGPSWLNPILLAAVRKADRIEPDDVEVLTDLGPEAVSCLVDLLVHKAGVHRGIDMCWPAVKRLLATHGVQGTRDVMNGLLRQQKGKHEDLPGAHKARMDVLCLLSGKPPRYQALLESASNEYLDTVRHELSTMNESLLDLVTRRLLEHLVSRFDAIPPDVVQRLDHALGLGIKRRYLDMLARWLEEGRLQTVLALRLPQHWREDLEQRPTLTWYRSLRQLCVLVTTDADVGNVVQRALGALQHPFTADEVARALCTYAGKARVEAVDGLLWQLHNYNETGKRVVSMLCQNLFNDDVLRTQDFVNYVNDKRDWYARLSRAGTGLERY